MTALEQPVAELLREAAEWRLIGLLLECPSPQWRRRVDQLAREIAGDDPDLTEAVAQSRIQASEGLYHSTFGPGGPAPPREATHRDTLQLGYLISELSAFYGSFGYQPASAEPPDHIAVEAGFVAYLKFKQAFALTCGDTEAAEVTSEACREFLSEHLASTASPLAGMLTASGVPYLEATARALARRCGPAKPRFLVLGAEAVNGDHEDDYFGCGEAPSAASPEPEEQLL